MHTLLVHIWSDLNFTSNSIVQQLPANSLLQFDWFSFLLFMKQLHYHKILSFVNLQNLHLHVHAIFCEIPFPKCYANTCSQNPFHIIHSENISLLLLYNCIQSIVSEFKTFYAQLQISFSREYLHYAQVFPIPFSQKIHVYDNGNETQ